MNILVALMLSILALAESVNVGSENTTALGVERSGRFWGIAGIGIVRFENSVCSGNNGLMGTCYTRRQCRDRNGLLSGKCAAGVGACCVIKATCGDTWSENNTYFINKEFPSSASGSQHCILNIERDSDSICQVRIDLLTFILAQPNGDGVCNVDMMAITGGSQVPIICGENTGQHIYVNFNEGSSIQIAMSTRSSITLDRIWKIKVSQIACDSPSREIMLSAPLVIVTVNVVQSVGYIEAAIEITRIHLKEMVFVKAPSGCLQYFNAVSGTVKSFNYGQTISSSLVTGTNLPGTRQIANTNYGVCVGVRPGYCRIRWAPDGGDRFSFTLTSGTIGLTGNNQVGTPIAGISGAMCLTDFILIPNGNIAGTDRFCGNFMPPVTTSSQPFVLTVVTDGGELMDNGNRGFFLNFAQILCDDP